MVCIYDNEATMQREAWQDGKLVALMDWCLVDGVIKDQPEGIYQMYPFFMNVGPFKQGQIIFDKEAMERP